MGETTTARRAALAVGAVVVLVLVAVTVGWGLAQGGGGSAPDAEGSTSTATVHPQPSSGPSHRNSTPTSLGTPSAPGTGGTVPDPPVHTRKAVPLTTPAHWASGMSVRIAEITPVHGRATQPGEVSGPALSVQLVATNSSGKTRSLDGTVVSAVYGPDRAPAGELAQGEQRFSGRLGPHSSARATYVFTVPPSERGDLRILVSLTPTAPTVAFHGSA